jgi:polyisoprenoid-binding protein YceI
MKRLNPALLFVAASLMSFAAAAAYTRTADPGNVIFHGSGPGGLRIEGKTSAVELKEDDKILTITVPLKDLTTGISLRDNHMRNKYLEVEKFPETHLDVEKAALQVPAAGASVEQDAKGKLTLHGVTRDVTFHYKASCKADGVCDAEGKLAININDYGIIIPTYLGVTMKPDVTIDVAFNAKR